MRIDSPQSVGITSGFGMPTGGTINQVLSKVDNDNYDTQWANISGATVPFTATTDITKGYAVRLIEDGTIIKPDYVQNLATKGGYFGTSGDSVVNDYAYIDSTNQVLTLSFINNRPILYVGNVNPQTQEITYSGGTQLSTDAKDPNVSAAIHFDVTIGRALVAYKLTSNSAIKLISIQKTGSNYTKITEINTSLGNLAITEVRLTSNGLDPGNRFYVSARNTAENVRLREITVGNTTITPSLNESPNMPVAAESHDILQYHQSSILVVIYRSGQTFYNFWDASTNTWAQNFVNYLIYNGAPINQSTDLRIFRKNFDYYAAYVGPLETALIKFNVNQNAAPSSVQATNNFLLGTGRWFYPTDEFRVLSGWTNNGGTTAFYTEGNNVNQVVLSLAFSGLPNEDYITYWSTPATNGYFQDSVGNFYALGYNPNDFLKLFWNYLETIDYLDSPIIGIAQQSGTTGSIVEVAVENSVSNANTGLLPSFNYYSNPDGSLSVNGDTYVGVALSPTQINVSFSNPGGVTTPSLTVIDNTIGNPNNITTPGRYIVPVSGLTGSFVGNANDYADYDGSSFTFILPTNGDKASISTGPNAGNVYLFTSGATSGWTLSSQVTTLPTSNWTIGGTYKQNDLVIYQNVLYQANGNIPPNTAFIIGTTGTTWKQIAAEANSTWLIGKTYSQGALVVSGNSIYQSNSIIPSGTTFSVGTTGATWRALGAVPSGGTTGQILRKVNNTDYNTEWYGLSYASILFNSLNSGANQDQTPVLGPANGITVVGNTMIISRPGIYSLNANLPFRAGFVEYRWVDASNNQLVGTNVGIAGSLNGAEVVSQSPAAGIVNITSPNTIIKLRTGNIATPGTQIPGYAIATITQIA